MTQVSPPVPAIHVAAVNDEGQYSLWPSFRDVPAGWTAVMNNAQRQECLAYIERVWTDMRPRSPVEQMNRDAAERATSGSQVVQS